MTAFNKLHLIRQVDLFTLKLFLTAVEEGQIARAAAREHIAASAATKRIQELEEITGLKLLERTRQGVHPSPAGDVLVRYIRIVLGALDDMRDEIGEFSEGVRGHVTVASVRALIVPFLAQEMTDFMRDFPLVELRMKEAGNREAVHSLSTGESDVAVFMATAGIDLDGLDTATYRHDRLVAVVPIGHPLSEHGSVSFEALLDQDFIGISPNAPVMGIFQAAARRLGRELKPRYSVETVEVARSMVKARLGVTIQPASSLSTDTMEQVTSITLDEAWTSCDAVVATARSRPPSPATKAFIKHLLDQPSVAAMTDRVPPKP